MNEQHDFKKHFEAILGRNLDLGESGEVALRERVASYTTIAKHTGWWRMRSLR